jgi:hypothetical protein
MVPSHRRVGCADADPALNSLTTKALRFTGPALSFRGIGFVECFSSPRVVDKMPGLGDGRSESGLPATLI